MSKEIVAEMALRTAMFVAVLVLADLAFRAVIFPPRTLNAYTVGQRCTVLGQPVEIMEVHRDSDGPRYRVITAHMQTPMVRETTLEDCR